MIRFAFAALIAVAGCGAPSGQGGDGSAADAAAVDAAAAPDLATSDAAVAAPAACPASGKGALTDPNASCVVFPPSAAGADPAGVNAGDNDYALAPTGGGNGHLVLFLNPSLGSPAQAIADPATNIYTAGTAAGDHVLAIAYRSDQVLGVTCKGDDACFAGTRLALITGTSQPGCAPSVCAGKNPILPTEGIYSRAALALAHVAAAQPGRGWDQFVVAGADPMADPAGAVAWPKVFVMGHSQGGGHAAMVAMLQPVARLVTLSSPCDSLANLAPASWEHADGTWKTTPSAAGYGFATLTTFDNTGAPTGGDTTCPAHAAIWDALGYVSGHRFEDAAQCLGATAHTAPTQCTANMPRVQTLLTP